MFSYQLLPRAKTKHDAKEFKQGEDRTFSGGFGEREVRHAGNPSQGRKKVPRKRIIVSGDTEQKKNTSNLKSLSSPRRAGLFLLTFKSLCCHLHSHRDSAAFVHSYVTH